MDQNKQFNSFLLAQAQEAADKRQFDECCLICCKALERVNEIDADTQLQFHKLLIINAYYTKDINYKLMAEVSCDKVGFDRELPWEDRWFARINNTWYMRGATELYRNTTIKKIEWRPDNGYNCMNPSIVNHNGKVYILIRTVNYDIHYTENNHYYQMKDNDQWIVRTKNYLAELDGEQSIVNVKEVLLPEDLPDPSFNQVIGFEDMRVINWNDQLWCSSTVRMLDPEGHHEIVLARMDSKEDHVRLTEWRKVLPDHCPRAQEKNWMSVVHNGELKFVYSNEPVVVLDRHGHCVQKNYNVLALDNFRGGSPLIPFMNGYLTIIHETSVYTYMPRRYSHRFVYYNKNLQAVKLGDLFYFSEQGIEFAAGMCWNETNDKLLISYGFKDKEARIAIMDPWHIFHNLKSIPTLN